MVSTVSALDDDCKNGYVYRVNAWNAGGLRQRLRTVLLELLPTFKANCRALVIIKPPRNANGLVKFCPFRRLSLLLNIRRIMTHNIYFNSKCGTFKFCVSRLLSSV